METKTLQITAEQAKELYPTASEEFKKLLEETFGIKTFNVNERINTWEDMLLETGRPDVPEFSDLPEDLRQYFKATYKLLVMTEAYNGKRMDIYDENKNRYYPWFKTNGSSSGFRFHDSYCDISHAVAGSGSRLSFENPELAATAGKKHTEFYREFLEL